MKFYLIKDLLKEQPLIFLAWSGAMLVIGAVLGFIFL